MKARREDLRRQCCNRPESRRFPGRTSKSFTANGALPIQTISSHAPGTVARPHARLSHDPHRAGRSCRHYLWQLGRGDLGQSFKFQAPVRQIILERYPATLQLAFAALVVCAAIAIPDGMLRAYL